jgi:hypothetical protein
VKNTAKIAPKADPKIDPKYHQGTPHSTVPGVPHTQHKSQSHEMHQGPPPRAASISPGGERHGNDGLKDTSWEGTDAEPNNGPYNK